MGEAFMHFVYLSCILSSYEHEDGAFCHLGKYASGHALIHLLKWNLRSCRIRVDPILIQVVSLYVREFVPIITEYEIFRKISKLLVIVRADMMLLVDPTNLLVVSEYLISNDF